jgi:phospholipase C
MGAPVWNRRQVLGAGMAGGASLLLAACGASTLKKASSIAPAGSDLGAVDHVVFLMHENRSFDHYFGTYPGVRGFDDHLPGSLGAFAQPWPGGSAPTLRPFHFDTVSTAGECIFDLSHAWDVQHRCWDNGSMARFVATHTDPAVEGPANGVLTMGYYTRADLDFYYALADAFTLCDRYHCSVLGPTDPNRLHALSGTLDPGGHAGGPVVENPGNAEQFTKEWTAMPEVLERAGISWKTYNPPGSQFQPTSPVAWLLSDNILLLFKRFADPASSLYKKAFGPVFPADFARDVANGTVPQVSWLIPPNGVDEHPPAPPAAGMAYTHRVLEILVSNPKVWAKTVLFVMHDENDGFFDHVPPPTPPPGTPGEYVTAMTPPPGLAGIAGPIGLGVRVPMLVVSPFGRGGIVNSDVFDHTSQLRFLETRFGVRAPNISAWRRSVTGDLTSTLHMATPDTTVPSLPTTPGAVDPRVTRECSPGQMTGFNSTAAPYPVPTPQAMPTQENRS